MIARSYRVTTLVKALLHERLRAVDIARLPAVPRVDRAGVDAAGAFVLTNTVMY